MVDNTTYTLKEAVEIYLATRQINNKKYYPSFLISAIWSWKNLFKNTIYAVNSQWFTLKSGVPYNYVDMPPNVLRFFSATVVNECGEMIPLFMDNRINIIAQPTSSQKKCGCGACDCGGLCEDINSLTYTTKVLFTISGVDYYEKDWVKVCPNGDILEYRIVPTKKYNTFTGDGGDYNRDYNNDYLIGTSPFQDFTIEYVTTQKIICKLTLLPCGCPENTVDNINLLNNYCGCYLPFNAFCKRKQCNTKVTGEINGYDNLGSIKVSECGTKIYYIPHPTCDGTPPLLPTSLLLNWQTSGENCNEIVQVPEYAIETLFYGIDFNSKRFNNAYSLGEKAESKYNWQDAQNQLVLFLNPLNLDYLAQIQDQPILY